MFLLFCHACFFKWPLVQQRDRSRNDLSVLSLLANDFLLYLSKLWFYFARKVAINLSFSDAKFKFNRSFSASLSVMKTKKMVMNLWRLRPVTQLHRYLLQTSTIRDLK